MTLTHGSLFAGIGGFDYGFELVGIRTVWQVEMDPFCRRVLEKNFLEAKRHSDVRECGRHNLEKVDVISGGFPCQDVSGAGKKIGLNGTRSRLWWQQARIIGELRPDWVLIENVSRLLNTEGDRVLSVLEKIGYACWPLVLGAKEIGATHRRSRAWILCCRTHAGSNGHPEKRMVESHSSLAEAIKTWNGRIDELASANGCAGADAYARIVRESHGIPGWLDRLKSLGNAVVPQIPMLFGCFIQAAQENKRGHGA